MDRRDQLFSVTDSIYEAALDTTRLSSTLEAISNYIGAMSSDIYVQRGNRVLFGSYHGVSEELFIEYLANFHNDNPRIQVFENAPEMQILTDQEYLEERQIVGTPMFEEFLPKAGLRHMLGVVPARSSFGCVNIGIHFAKGAGPPDSRSWQAMEALLPHLRRLSQIRLRLMEEEFRARRLEATIDGLSAGIILLDREGQVTVMNQAAKSLVDDSHFLKVEKGVLRPSREKDRRRLERTIASALDRDGALQTAGGAFRMDDFESGRSLSLIISPLPSGRQLEEDLGAVIYISDGHVTLSELSQERLQSLWELTPAESRVAAEVACGTDLRTVALRNGISIHTVRSQMKQVLAKTGARRQSELVKFVLLGPGSITDPVV